eukprot:2739143-Pyramimonas_sp.AAC.1
MRRCVASARVQPDWARFLGGQQGLARQAVACIHHRVSSQSLPVVSGPSSRAASSTSMQVAL